MIWVKTPIIIYSFSIYLFILINIGVWINLCIFQLIPRALKLIII
jgi:hypothetical protein